MGCRGKEVWVGMQARASRAREVVAQLPLKSNCMLMLHDIITLLFSGGTTVNLSDFWGGRFSLGIGPCQIRPWLITRRTVEVIFSPTVTRWIYLVRSPHISRSISITRFPGILKSLGLSLSPKTPGKEVKSDFHRPQVENDSVWFSQWWCSLLHQCSVVIGSSRAAGTWSLLVSWMTASRACR